MGSYRVFDTDQFFQDLSQYFEGQGERFANKLRDYVYPQLKEYPHLGKNIKKLKNYRLETWRCRIGGYRLFYEIDEKEGVVYMLALDSRKYREHYLFVTLSDHTTPPP